MNQPKQPAFAAAPASQQLSLDQLQSNVDNWIKSVGVRYFSELSNLAQLTEEVGELARVISRTYGEQSWKQDAERTEIADELADVLFVVVCLANQTGVNLTEAIDKNLQKKTSRDSQRHQNNSKLK